MIVMTPLANVICSGIQPQLNIPLFAQSALVHAEASYESNVAIKVGAFVVVGLDVDVPAVEVVVVVESVDALPAEGAVRLPLHEMTDSAKVITIVFVKVLKNPCIALPLFTECPVCPPVGTEITGAKNAAHF
jgi:hypothetical protein